MIATGTPCDTECSRNGLWDLYYNTYGTREVAVVVRRRRLEDDDSWWNRELVTLPAPTMLPTNRQGSFTHHHMCSSDF